MKPTITNIDTPPRSGVLSQGLISMVAYGVNFAASFFAVIGIIRILGKEPWGLFALAIQIVAFTAMITDFGIGPVIMRRLAIAPGRASSILLEATAGRLLLLIPTWVISIVIGWQVEPSWTFFLLLNIMLLNIVISSKIPVLRGTLEAFFRSQSRMGIPTITMAIDSVMLLTAVLVVPLSFHDPVTAMILYTASNILGAVIMLVLGISFARRLNTEPVRISWNGTRELIVVSAPLAVYLLLNALHVSIDSIYLKLFHGADQVGVFNAALRLMTPLAVFPTIVAISAAPYFARASVSDDDEQRARMSRLFSLSVKTLLIGAVLLAGFGIANTRLMVGAAFAHKYNDAMWPMAILFIVFLPMALNIFLVEFNNARGQLRNNTIFAAILAVTSVSAGAVLIWQYAATGAAVAKLLAVVAGLAFLIFHSRAGIAVAMKPVIWKTAVLFLSLLAVRVGLDSTHWLISNTAALLVVLTELFVLRVYSADEIHQWKSQFAGLFGKSVVGVNHLPDTDASHQNDSNRNDSHQNDSHQNDDKRDGGDS